MPYNLHFSGETSHGSREICPVAGHMEYGATSIFDGGGRR